MEKSLKYIFWDNDGVLVDTEKLYFEATKIVLKEEGLNLSKDIFVKNILNQSRGVWFLLEEKNYSQNKINILREKRNEIYHNFLKNEITLIPGVNETLKKCSEKFKMAIVTSSRKDHFLTTHNSTGSLKYFDFYLTRENYKISKPDPEPYLLALKQSGVASSEVIVIEDSERGLKSALSAGLKCIIIPNDLTKRSNFTGAEIILNNHSEIFDYLLWNNNKKKNC